MCLMALPKWFNWELANKAQSELFADLPTEEQQDIHYSWIVDLYTSTSGEFESSGPEFEERKKCVKECLMNHPIKDGTIIEMNI